MVLSSILCGIGVLQVKIHHRSLAVYLLLNNMTKDFFNPLKKPFTKDPFLLLLMILTGIVIIGIAYYCESILLIVLLSLFVFIASVLIYCFCKKQ